MLWGPKTPQHHFLEKRSKAHHCTCYGSGHPPCHQTPGSIQGGIRMLGRDVPPPHLGDALVRPKVDGRVRQAVEDRDPVPLPEGHEPLLADDAREGPPQSQLPCVSGGVSGGGLQGLHLHQMQRFGLLLTFVWIEKSFREDLHLL